MPFGFRIATLTFSGGQQIQLPKHGIVLIVGANNSGKSPPNGGELSGKKGVVLFEVRGWDDAAGHATLWNGRQCYDHCYFNEPGANYRTDRASFWVLP
jgi:hypothetical protein